MNTLEAICIKKRELVAQRKIARPQTELITNLRAMADQPRGFLNALKSKQAPALIAEVKKASPSKGIIRADFNPSDIACAYETAGATCLSVLTDGPYFQGKDEDFLAVRRAVSLPMLRKDFMLDPYQIYESRTLGADCILLIIAALDDVLARDLYARAVDIGMDVLVEVHDAEELNRALLLNPMMVGVNNRNLKTLTVDLDTSRVLASQISNSIYKVAESGIADHATLLDLAAHGYGAFLVGESLMKQSDIVTATITLLNGN